MSDKLRLIPGAPVTPEFVVDKLNEDQPHIGEIAVAYTYADPETGVMKTRYLTSEGDDTMLAYLSKVLDVHVNEMILNGFQDKF